MHLHFIVRMVSESVLPIVSILSTEKSSTMSVILSLFFILLLLLLLVRFKSFIFYSLVYSRCFVAVVCLLSVNFLAKQILQDKSRAS